MPRNNPPPISSISQEIIDLWTRGTEVRLELPGTEAQCRALLLRLNRARNALNSGKDPRAPLLYRAKAKVESREGSDPRRREWFVVIFPVDAQFASMIAAAREVGPRRVETESTIPGPDPLDDLGEDSADENHSTN